MAALAVIDLSRLLAAAAVSVVLLCLVIAVLKALDDDRRPRH